MFRTIFAQLAFSIINYSSQRVALFVTFVLFLTDSWQVLV